jgi:lysozyme
MELSENDKLLVSELRRDEGVVPYAYQDSLGYWTIGVGRLIHKGRGKLSDDEIDYLLMNDIDKVVAGLDTKAPWWRTLSPVRQRVMVNMSFNMGIGWIDKFKNTVAAIREGRYDDASKGMLASLWAKQVKGRADRLAKMMRER